MLSAADEAARLRPRANGVRHTAGKLIQREKRRGVITKVGVFAYCSKCRFILRQVFGSEFEPVSLDLATKQAISIEEVRVLQKCNAFEIEYLVKLEDETNVW